MFESSGKAYLKELSNVDKKGEWKYRSNAGKSTDPIRAENEKLTFFVNQDLQSKFNALLKPLRLMAEGNKQQAEIKDLPAGYSLVVKLYRDSEFMDTVRYGDKLSIEEYLTDRHPDIVEYIKMHKLRVTSHIIGSTNNEKHIMLAEKDSLTCAVSETVAAAAVNAGAGAGAGAAAAAAATAEAGAGAGAGVAAAVAVAAASNAVACVSSKGSNA